MIAPFEKTHFTKLLIRVNRVLDFSSEDLGNFICDSVGQSIFDKYYIVDGNSLSYFIHTAPAEVSLKLLSDLIRYYESNYRAEFDDNASAFNQMYVAYYSEHYSECKKILERETVESAIIADGSRYLKEKFSSQYLSDQIDLLAEMRITNPTEAIGKAKELIESCCKTILSEQSICINKNDVNALLKQTQKVLDISSESVDENVPAGDIIKRLFGNLHGVAVGIAELRNSYGSGHGKAATYRGLEIRHAKLAVGCSVTICEYLWETYEWRINNGKLRRR